MREKVLNLVDNGYGMPENTYMLKARDVNLFKYEYFPKLLAIEL